jgi:uncharacterized protein (DUF302 family)
MTAMAQEKGIIRIRSAHSAPISMDRLEAQVHARGLTVFALVDFSGDASRVGLTMPFTQLLMFGNPRSGTPVMSASPSAALDLPLKVVVSEDSGGLVWLACNDPLYLQQRHLIPEDVLKNISGVETILRQVAS